MEIKFTDKNVSQGNTNYRIVALKENGNAGMRMMATCVR